MLEQWWHCGLWAQELPMEPRYDTNLETMGNVEATSVSWTSPVMLSNFFLLSTEDPIKISVRILLKNTRESRQTIPKFWSEATDEAYLNGVSQGIDSLQHGCTAIDSKLDDLPTRHKAESSCPWGSSGGCLQSWSKHDFDLIQSCAEQFTIWRGKQWANFHSDRFLTKNREEENPFLCFVGLWTWCKIDGVTEGPWLSSRFSSIGFFWQDDVTVTAKEL